MLVVRSSSRHTWSATTCKSQPYSFGALSLDTTGIYTDTIHGGSAYGCDSIVTLNLTVLSYVYNSYQNSICQGNSITYGSHVYTTAGTYTDTLPSPILNGCPIIYTLTLSVGTQIPDVTWPDTDTLFCAYPLGLTLSGGMPQGGFYTGDYVVGDYIIFPSGYPITKVKVNYVYIDSNGCKDSASHLYIFNDCAGIQEPESDLHPALYPNPASCSFTITNNYPSAVSVSIFNMLGQKIKSYNLTGAKPEINISDLTDGIYQVQISDGNKVLKVLRIEKQ